MKTVTCICVTKGRKEMLRGVIHCFRKQTYEARTLLIVPDSWEDIDEKAVGGDPRIKVLLHGPACKTIGTKRNFAVESSDGELIAHWDDDDVSGTNRLDYQVTKLIEAEKMVTGFHSMKFTDGLNWWRYMGVPNFSLGTSLVYFKYWAMSHPFPEVQVGEDNAFVTTAWAKGELLPLDASATSSMLAPGFVDGLDLMYARIHSGNTSKKETSACNWRKL